MLIGMTKAGDNQRNSVALTLSSVSWYWSLPDSENKICTSPQTGPFLSASDNYVPFDCRSTVDTHILYVCMTLLKRSTNSISILNLFINNTATTKCSRIVNMRWLMDFLGVSASLHGSAHTQGVCINQQCRRGWPILSNNTVGRCAALLQAILFSPVE